MFPTVRRIHVADCPLRLSPLALVHVTEGEFLLRGDGGTHKLLAGEILALRVPAEEALHGASVRAEALLFHAPPSWVARARSLVGDEEPVRAMDPLVREAAGSAAARRAGRILLTAYLEANEEHGERSESVPGAIEPAARLIELVGLALAMGGSIVAPRRPSGGRARSHRAQLVRALEALESAPLDGFTLGVLAGRLGVSERQTSRLLREELGTSFPEYLTALRIDRAKKLLATTEEPVTDVALSTGWQSLSHFNAVFRRRVGSTPTRYRAIASAKREFDLAQ